MANERVSRPRRQHDASRRPRRRPSSYGGKFDGHELPDDINAFTKTSATNLVGPGPDGRGEGRLSARRPVAVLRRRLRRSRSRHRDRASYTVLDYTAVADVGTVLNPRSLQGQLFGGSMLGLGHARSQRWAYDQHYGVALAKRFYQNKPPTILDTPIEVHGRGASNLPDPETPTGHPRRRRAAGRRGVRRGDERDRRRGRRRDLPAVAGHAPTCILNALENGGQRTHEALTAHI